MLRALNLGLTGARVICQIILDSEGHLLVVRLLLLVLGIGLAIGNELRYCGLRLLYLDRGAVLDPLLEVLVHGQRLVGLLDPVQRPNVLISYNDLMWHFKVVVRYVLDIVDVLSHRLALLIQSGYSTLVVQLGLLLVLNVLTVARVCLV